MDGCVWMPETESVSDGSTLTAKVTIAVGNRACFIQSDDLPRPEKSDLRGVIPTRDRTRGGSMLHQIALSVVLLIFALTTLPRLQAEPGERVGEQHFSVPPQHPMIDPDKPKAIDVRVTIDPPLNDIAQWLSENYDLPYASELPRVERVPTADLYRLRYKGLLPLRSQAVGGEHSTPPPEYRREVVAVYDDTSRTIFLPQRWTGATVAEQSVVVHEMVHHLQNLGGVKYECAGAREKPAYLAQNQWLKAHGLDLEKEFEVDMFTVVALSGCMN
jgi:hypothetical protein